MADMSSIANLGVRPVAPSSYSGKSLSKPLPLGLAPEHINSLAGVVDDCNASLHNKPPNERDSAHSIGESMPQIIRRAQQDFHSSFSAAAQTKGSYLSLS